MDTIGLKFVIPCKYRQLLTGPVFKDQSYERSAEKEDKPGGDCDDCERYCFTLIVGLSHLCCFFYSIITSSDDEDLLGCAKKPVGDCEWYCHSHCQLFMLFLIQYSHKFKF